MRDSPSRNRKIRIYGFLWAEEQVVAFMERYPRGVGEFLKCSEMSRNALFSRLVRAIRRDQTVWETYKRLIKSLERTPSPTNLPKSARRKYYTDVWHSHVRAAIFGEDPYSQY